MEDDTQPEEDLDDTQPESVAPPAAATPAAPASAPAVTSRLAPADVPAVAADVPAVAASAGAPAAAGAAHVDASRATDAAAMLGAAGGGAMSALSQSSFRGLECELLLPKAPVAFASPPPNKAAKFVLVVRAPIACVWVLFPWNTLIAFTPLSGALPPGFPDLLLKAEFGVKRLSLGCVCAEFVAGQRGDGTQRWLNAREFKISVGTWPQFDRDARALESAAKVGGAVALLRALESLPPPPLL